MFLFQAQLFQTLQLPSHLIHLHLIIKSFTVKYITIIHSSNSQGPIFSLSGTCSLRIYNLTVRGSTVASSLSNASYSFIVVNNGGTVSCEGVSFWNLTFSTGSIVSTNSSCSIQLNGLSSWQIQNIYSNGSVFISVGNNGVVELTSLKFIQHDLYWEYTII
jgi:hypothetical protein